VTRKGTLAAAIAFTVFIAGAPGASSALHDGAEDRRIFATEYKNEGVYMSTAGIRDQTLVIETNPPDVAQCSQTLDVVAADKDFIRTVSARGFTEISCIAYDDQMHIVSSEPRKILPVPPPAPVQPFKSRDNRRIAVA
jgi:hypothetical protein